MNGPPGNLLVGAGPFCLGQPIACTHDVTTWLHTLRLRLCMLGIPFARAGSCHGWLSIPVARLRPPGAIHVHLWHVCGDRGL